MGKPFEMRIVERFVGHCDACGVAGKGEGVQTGPVTTIGMDCAEQITRLLNSRTIAAVTAPRSRPTRRQAVA